MGFQALMIKDSISPAGIRIRTFEIEYPRFIHSEFMTHSEFNRNASSSRAIPVMKVLKQVWNDPVIPVHWGGNIPGMQAKEELSGWRKKAAKFLWVAGSKVACGLAYTLCKLGLHKQLANRVLEPWQWIRVITTTTSTSNLFGLRCHADAQPEFQHLANLMALTERGSTPELLMPGQWHLPYIREGDWFTAFDLCKRHRITRDIPKDEEVYEILRKVSSARCARVSYLTHEKRVPGISDDVGLFSKLVESKPVHASPTGHQATPVDDTVVTASGPHWNHPGYPDTWQPGISHVFRDGTFGSGNLKGWVQFRKLIPNEYIS